MKQNEAIAVIADTLAQADSPMTPQQIAEKTGIVLMTVHKCLKQMLTEEKVVSDKTDGVIVYSSVPTVQEDAMEESAGEEIEDAPKKRDKATSQGRNMDKVTFRGVGYPKGRYVLEYLRALLADHAITHDELKEAFPDTIVGKFGVFAKQKEAKELSKQYRRYFINDDETLVTADKVKICVTNQWSSQRLEDFQSKADAFVKKPK